ncbi:MAG TPA: cysteine synthase family protein [Thermodesulfobacteriota bacterium]|nr:cysteine synthase family protein [Thermodesulfobacteriota bacterium]
MKIKKGILELIGNTPLVKLEKITEGLNAEIYLKLESFNPTGSIKDRVALYFIEDAEKRGDLKPGDVIVEATSGNTGTSLAMVAAVKGYRCMLVLPETVSTEKIKALRAFGAEVILTPAGLLFDDERSYYSVAEKIAKQRSGAYLNQYFNPINPESHFRTTGPEIWRDTNGEVDVVICGIGTGGTISGIGRYLKGKKANVKVIGVEPVGSVYRTYLRSGKVEKATKFKIEGIGKNFIPGVIDFHYIDDVIQVDDEESFKMVETLMKDEGILAGGSGGAAIAGALKYAQYADKKEYIVTILPDTGLKYLSKSSEAHFLQATFLKSADG